MRTWIWEHRTIWLERQESRHWETHLQLQRSGVQLSLPSTSEEPQGELIKTMDMCMLEQADLDSKWGSMLSLAAAAMMGQQHEQ